MTSGPHVKRVVSSAPAQPYDPPSTALGAPRSEPTVASAVKIWLVRLVIESVCKVTDHDSHVKRVVTRGRVLFCQSGTLLR